MKCHKCGRFASPARDPYNEHNRMIQYCFCSKCGFVFKEYKEVNDATE